MKLGTKPGRAGKVHIYIDGEYRLTVDDIFWFTEKWYAMDELSEGELAELTLAVSSRRAFLSGADLLSRRPHGRTELFRKLMRKYPEKAASDAVEKLAGLGLLDDEKYAGLLAEELYSRRNFGAARIRQELLRRGISGEIADAAVEMLDKNDLERIIDLLQTKYEPLLGGEKGNLRVKNALLRLGYGYSDIRAAFGALREEREDMDDG